jgi:hypothetical protein
LLGKVLTIRHAQHNSVSSATPPWRRGWPCLTWIDDTARAHGTCSGLPGEGGVEVLTTIGRGTSWVNGLRGIPGLPGLAGGTLTSAATLAGAMVDKP